MSHRSTVYIMKEDDWFVANSIETGVASQGKTMEDAIKNLKEALELYFEDNTNIPPIEVPFLTSLEVTI